MNCIVCEKKIENKFDNPRIDAIGANILSDGARSRLKREIKKTNSNVLESSEILQVCSNECFNKKLYEVLNENVNTNKNIFDMENILDLNSLFGKPMSKEDTERNAREIEELINFIKTKLESFK